MRILSQSISEGAHSRFTWVAAGVVTLLFGVVAAFGTVQGTPDPVFARTIVEPLALPARSELLPSLVTLGSFAVQSQVNRI